MYLKKRPGLTLIIIILVFVVAQAGCGSGGKKSSKSKDDIKDDIIDTGKESLTLKKGEDDPKVLTGDPDSIWGAIDSDSDLTHDILYLGFNDLQEGNTKYYLSMMVFDPAPGKTYNIDNYSDCLTINYASTSLDMNNSEIQPYAAIGCNVLKTELNGGSGTIKITELGSVGDSIKGEYDLVLREFVEDPDDPDNWTWGQSTIKVSGSFDVIREESSFLNE